VFSSVGYVHNDLWCYLGVIFTVQLPVLYAIQSKTNTFRLGWDLGWDRLTVGKEGNGHGRLPAPGSKCIYLHTC